MKMAVMSNGKTDSLDSIDMDPDPEETPYVVQCIACNSIISDSNQCVATDETLKVFTVNCTTDSVMIDKKITTAESGMDEGSSFRFLKCKKCKTYIGKQYKTTTQEFDHLRNYFSFDVNLITCYQIGSCDKESDIPQNDSILEVPTARSLQKSIHQLQALVIEMADKVVKIEERLENKTSNPKVSQASPRYMLSSPQKHLSRNGNPVTRRFPLESESVESESESESEGNAFVAENQYQASRRKGPQKRKR
ncbi:uncharacterized protein [Ptychodera flava]|uniref:uncharacterized protein isoform X2 n=1 Tax=Ptychodera flava TaxID=63121 RepID=UPI00396AA06B